MAHRNDTNANGTVHRDPNLTKVKEPVKLIFELIFVLLALIPCMIWSLIEKFVQKPKSIKGKVVLVRKSIIRLFPVRESIPNRTLATAPARIFKSDANAKSILLKKRAIQLKLNADQETQKLFNCCTSGTIYLITFARFNSNASTLK